MKDIDELEVCKECKSADWLDVTEQTPPNGYPDSSEVSKHILRCSSCGSVARVYEDDGYETYSGALRGQDKVY